LCGDGSYANVITRECVLVNSAYNGCGEGYVGNDVGGIKLNYTYYHGGSCIPESVCRESGYYVDAAHHKCVTECPGDTVLSLNDEKTCIARSTCDSLKHAQVADGACACKRNYVQKDGKCAMSLKLIIIIAAPAAFVVIAAVVIIVVVCVLRKRAQKTNNG